MAPTPLISICIPAYGRAHLLRRLLDSIVSQTFQEFEVIVTDNSQDEQVANLCQEYAAYFSLSYHKNAEFLQMGGNWNACMHLANGHWLKMMHDDDWFTGPDSLEVFAAEARRHEKGFIFSGFYNVEDGSTGKTMYLRTPMDLFFLKGSPFNILRGNYIGAPSVTLIHRNTFLSFNPGLKWMVDTEGFLRIFQQRHGIHYIKAPLLSIGIHTGQATAAAFRNPEIEIYENCVMLHAHYPAFCANYFAYDHCWRLMRNLEIRDERTLLKYSREAPVPPVFLSIVRMQRALPGAMLRHGLFSKGFMLLHYIYFNGFLLISR